MDDNIVLKGKRVEVDSAYYGSSPILLSHGLLVSKSNSTTSNCVISQLENTRLWNFQDIFSVGNGNNEFHNVAIAEGIDSTLYVLDYPDSGNKMLSITKIPSNFNVSSLNEQEMWQKYSLMSSPPFRCVFNTFVLLTDSTFLVPGSPYSEIGHILSVVNFKSQDITPLVFWPDDGTKCDSLAKHSVYTDNCNIYGNNRKQFLYVCGEERFAFIFSIEKNSINIKKELYSVYPDYRCNGDGNYAINMRSGNSMTAAVNNENICLLLIKEKLEDNYVSRLGNEIEIYDWDGDLQKRIKLDRSGSFIKVSEDNILYLFTNNPETGDSEIWMYNL